MVPVRFNRSISLAGCCILASLILSSCGDGLLPAPTPKKVEQESSGALEELGAFTELGTLPEAKPTIPVRWTLTDVDGRTLDATIVGKDSTTITLVRTADGKRFDLVLSRLSESDQTRVKRLDNKVAPTDHPMESSLYRMGQAKLDDIENSIVEQIAIIESTDSQIKRRSAYSELRRLNAEKAEVMKDLKELERY